MGHSRPKINEQHIDQIRQLLIDNPEWSRSKLSRELCEIWGWKSETGQLKDISCRDLLRALEESGQIMLPAKKRPGAVKSERGWECEQLSFFDQVEQAPIETKLKTVIPLIIEVADAREKIGEFKSLIDQYHYLGYGRSVGECIRYTVKSRDGTMLACLMFGSSAWRCASRDKYIGWHDEERQEKLYLTTNNTRFLILPWIRIPYLASHILSLIARRISQDWQTKYGHPLYLLETFVERDRFAGTCYKAANWTRVGETTGRGRDSISVRATLPIKDIYVRPLTIDFRKKLAVQTLSEQKEGDEQ